MLSVTEAVHKILAVANGFPKENISITESLGRVLAEELQADRHYPPFNRASMDGFAFRFEDLNEFPSLQVIEEIHAGYESKKTLTPGSCSKIMTGAPTPAGADTIIKVEDTLFDSSNQTVSFTNKNIIKGSNIAKMGEDLTAGEIVISDSCLIDSGVISILATLGKNNVKIFAHPVITVISTGTEIRKAEEEVLSYQIRDSNSYTIQAFLDNYRIPIYQKLIVDDSPEKIEQCLIDALKSDIVIISGGVSAGDADFIPGILEKTGVEKIFHKVKVKPGKPLWFGKKGKCAVFALPGNPFSVQVALKIFVEPYLRKCYSLPPPSPVSIPFSSERRKKTPFDEFFPCIIDTKNNQLKTKSHNGSGDITSTLFTHGIGHHSSEKEYLRQGELVDLYFWKSFF